jgi:hypothetical protein
VLQEPAQRRTEMNEALGLKKLVVRMLLEKHMFQLLVMLGTVVQSQRESFVAKERAMLCLLVSWGGGGGVTHALIYLCKCVVVCMVFYEFMHE